MVAMTMGMGLMGAALAQQAPEPEDPHLWLEAVEDEAALAWAREQNERSESLLRAHPLFDAMRASHLDILTAQDRIAFPSLMGGAVYNFWRDAQHVRGIWRSTQLDAYRAGSDDWDILLDVDALAASEDQNWVWAGSSCRYPDYDRCLIGLSIGGADAAVRREFDLTQRQFVDDGFVLPESKSRLGWMDRDTVFLGPAFSDEQMTDSGYPRLVQLWRRGTPYSEAETIYEGQRSDVAVTGLRIWDGDTPHDMIVRSPSFFTRFY